jgi:hypothetical protein
VSSVEDHPAPGMSSLDRVMHLARSHDYRIGLQIGEETHQVVLGVRDMRKQERSIAVLAPTIDAAATALFAEMLRRQYVPRGEQGMVS